MFRFVVLAVPPKHGIVAAPRQSMRVLRVKFVAVVYDCWAVGEVGF